MLRVYNCIVDQHDLRLVALAALVCCLASVTALSLLHHVRRSLGTIRRLWLGVAAATTGFGIWATHFIAMLAFSPSLPHGYDVVLTGASLLVAIAVIGLGFAVSLRAGAAGATWVGGAIVGGGIAAMHYTGMAAFEVAGQIVWYPPFVAASILLGTVIGSASLTVGLRKNTIVSKALGAILLTLAICSHHFTAMAAATVVPDASIEVHSTTLPANWLAIGVAVAILVILLLSFAGQALDMRDRHLEREAAQMRSLADAVVEGLLICDGETIVTVNNSFAALTGYAVEVIVGAELSLCLPNAVSRLNLLGPPSQPVEAELRRADGTMIPVELVTRPIDFVAKQHRAIAVWDLTGRKRAEQRISFLAHHDVLTGLPNRASLNDRLDAEIEAHQGTNTYLALLSLDLDRFKEINDLFGHGAGDALLQSIAECVTSVLTPNQMMARLGGDEFAVILPGLEEPALARDIAASILAAFKSQVAASPVGAFVTASIGIAVYPTDALDRRGLLNQADIALYRAKDEGRGVYRCFEAAMGTQIRDKQLLDHDLRQAISRQQLRLVYQPQTRLDTGEIVGFEVLLRWTHAERGDVSPTVFIPLAEESGAILEIGEWVLARACREAASWKKPLSIAVNVSATQLHSGDFARTVHRILRRTGLAPDRLELEITETALIRDLDRALASLRQLKALGLRVAMDDFGTGYSSLSNLRAFPFDKIKIDGSFIRCVDMNEQAATIVRAVLGLGRGLGLPVLAEGVETVGELNFLAAESCNEAQGYFMGRPASIEQFHNATHGARPASVPIPGDPEHSLANKALLRAV